MIIHTGMVHAITCATSLTASYYCRHMNHDPISSRGDLRTATQNNTETDILFQIPRYVVMCTRGTQLKLLRRVDKSAATLHAVEFIISIHGLPAHAALLTRSFQVVSLG